MSTNAVSRKMRTVTDAALAGVVRQDLARGLLAVLLIILLVAASFWVLRPFLLPTLWATTIVVATWPLMLKVQARLHRRGFAAALMSSAMVLVFVAPLFLAIRTLVANTETIGGWLRALPAMTIPPPPAWLANLPLIGAKLADQWTGIAAAGKEELGARIAPYASEAAQWIGNALGSVGVLALHFALTVVIATIMFMSGEAARSALLRFGRRLDGARGERVVLLSGQAIRAVALGVVVTALVQTLLAGLGLALTGVPFAGLLTGAILLLCIAQVGPLLVLLPAVVWLFAKDATAAGVVLLVWTILVGGLDNVLRPLLIRRGANLPLLLIFAGVIGGLLAFGIIGLFIGPVVLAVGYTLLGEWIAEQDRDEPRPR